ncbi:hypothetical protein ALT_7116 [Aspergillus lentulus]|uniref:Uncharacterized protein n=1 Tax=Aspergillus lentulus TaxID=293939 RepID=A0AAN5YGS7_ASPLE|nr:uncharacterized protein IFM58399_02922 [Aspergillus lentulus]KAF4152116.1 hypothetical protein CNMCM6069_002538 [Aspergillus lentulus]KAF4162079.1 hypothetical protein CNMCM6936_002606 [Aspergillus lentulus]KAF4171883.1 hypothetical protein CNMCM8060_002311 [Aspergillus lentulus]KAF4178647.1 hypothetical protein CNMCM7927_002416 [Aspergillus lentulus]KAF4191437.1 hypothetical protein CNMCM8694_001837 [Aspergillus lentulus]
MAGSKTESAVRFPERDAQTRRLRNQTTQDKKAVARMQDQGASAQARVARATHAGEEWTPVETLETAMDRDGNPVPDPAYTDYDKMSQHKGGEDEADDYVAANANFDVNAKIV